VRAKAILQRRRSASRARCSGARVRYAGRSTRPRLCNRVRSEIERRHPRLLSHGDDDLASSMTLFDVPDGRWGLAKRCREYCSATSPRWAERTTRIEGVAGGFLQTTAVWVAVDVETGRPVRLDHSFTRIYGPSAEGRRASAHLTLGGPPPLRGASKRFLGRPGERGHLGLDSTYVFSRSTRRQGVDRTYKKGYALHPLLCQGQRSPARLRRGRAGPSTGTTASAHPDRARQRRPAAMTTRPRSSPRSLDPT